MLRARFALFLLVAGLGVAPFARAQTPTPSTAAELLALTKKIDEQNIKIDALSQQILKLQQAMTHGHSAPASNIVGVPNAEEGAASAAPVPPASGNSHVVTRGETLTSIAKQYKVGIDDLRKLNHIEDDRKLQTGQTLAIPGAATPSPAASPTP
jgi:LysM repeat protein